MRNIITSLLILILNIFVSSSCKKFVEIPPSPTQIMNYKVFENDATANRAILGIYSQMNASGNHFSTGQTTFYAGMASDELYFFSPDAKREFVDNEITSNNHDLLSVSFWSPAYKLIYAANACIEGLTNSNTISPDIKQSLIGEAKFIRAYCYFYLVNLFGDVPLITNTNYQLNGLMTRTSSDSIYNHIILDLVSSKSLLPESYIHNDRIRPNKFAASALLARVYLYEEDWQNAIKESSSVLNSGLYTLNPILNNTFIKSSKETIFQLQPGANNINTWEANTIIPASNSVIPSYLITEDFIESIEDNDLRKLNWIMPRIYGGQEYFYPYKYKVQASTTVSENYILLRLAEQFLIRAEAFAKMNNLDDALHDLNIVRTRAGLPSIEEDDQAEVLKAIAKERRIELFAEWGHRWFDLKRTNMATQILSLIKPNTWEATDVFWPIPSNQILLNPELTQNPGY